MGSSGGRSYKTNTVIRTANTPSENALNRSGVALARNTIRSFTVPPADSYVGIRVSQGRAIVLGLMQGRFPCVLS